MSAASTLETLRDSAVSAIASGDYASAISYAERALVILATIPNHYKGQSRLEWDRDSIVSFIENCRKSQSSSVGIGASTGAVQFQYLRAVNESEL
jgi:hypothetical protein